MGSYSSTDHAIQWIRTEDLHQWTPGGTSADHPEAHCVTLDGLDV